MALYRTSNALPPVVKNLLIINGLVYLAQVVLSQQGISLEIWGALWPIQSPYFKIWQLLTHMFMHGGFMHLLFNMFGLWMFGRYLEEAWGPKRFLEFYLLCGLFAGAAHLLLSDGGSYAVGASGAIMGVFVAFAYLYPNVPLFLMFIPIPVKAKWAIPGLMAIDVFGQIAQVPGDNIAHWAHLGGALAGFIICWIWSRNRRNTTI